MNSPPVDRRTLLQVAAWGSLGAWASNGADASEVAPTAAAVEGDAAVETASRIAFRRLLATLSEIDEEWIGPGRDVPVEDVPLGHRALAMVLWGALDQYLENDPADPELVRLISPLRKWGDNPDGIYFYAPLDGRGTYRLQGVPGDEVYRSFTVHGGDANGGWATRVVSALNQQELALDADGGYTITLSAEPRPGNWLRLAEDSGGVISRFYFQDRAPAALDRDKVPRLSIETLDVRSGPPPPPTDAVIAARLDRVANWVRSKFGGQLLPDPSRRANRPSYMAAAPNQIGSPTSWKRAQADGGYGPVDVVYAAGQWELEAGQALIVEGRLPQAVYAGVTLWNRFGQTEDYRYRPVSLNRNQMSLGPGDRYRIVVAAEDPGVPNWLDTAGRRTGTLWWRFMLPSEQPEAPRCHVAPVSMIRRRALSS
jgi:hypothetical protein